MSSAHAEAQLSDSLQGLFPAGIVAAELRGCASAADLTPEELACVARASTQRVREFAAGRLCARRALREFGIAGRSLLPGADRRPLWPAGIVGSISHTAGYCVAAVAEARAFGAIGIDVEAVGDVIVDIWPTVFLARERRRLAALSPPERAVESTLIFSAKEAFYKAQFALVGERLDFHDVRIDLPEPRGAENRFLIVPQRPIALAARTAPPFAGRYRRDGGHLAAAFAIAAGAIAPGLSTPCRRETP
jgi:4'-phosphopantetheinyl transferase EntD